MKKQILLLRLDAIGDFILFSSLLPSLREHFSEDHITMIVHPNVAPLAKGCPYVDEIWTVDPDKYASDREYAEKLIVHVRGKFDIAINAMYTRTDISDNIIARTHAPIKIGFECTDKDGQQERRLREQQLYSHLIPSLKEWTFEIDRYGQLLSYLNPESEAKKLKPDLWIREEEMAWANEFLGKHIKPNSKFVIVAPGAGDSIRYWKSEYLASVCDTLSEKYNTQIVFVGSQSDKELVASITKFMKAPFVDASGMTTLRQKAAMITRAELLVGMESSGFHLAWSLDIPTVGIVGGGHFGRFTPSLPHVRVVHVPMDCYYCYWHCIYDEIKCITSITPEMVMAEIEQVYRKENEAVG